MSRAARLKASSAALLLHALDGVKELHLLLNGVRAGLSARAAALERLAPTGRLLRGGRLGRVCAGLLAENRREGLLDYLRVRFFDRMRDDGRLAAIDLVELLDQLFHFLEQRLRGRNDERIAAGIDANG